MREAMRERLSELTFHVSGKCTLRNVIFTFNLEPEFLFCGQEKQIYA